MDEPAMRFLSDLMCKVVMEEISVPQAVAMVDDFAEGIKGKLPDSERMELKADMLQYVFSLRDSMAQHVRKETPEERAHRMVDEYVAEHGPPDCIVSIREEVESPLWEEIKRHLPAEMLRDEKTMRKNAWRIGFLLGYGGERIGANLLRWLWRLP